MNTHYWIRKAATALGMIVLVKLLSVPFAVACPYLQCTNFTDPKLEDCKYIASQGFSEDEEQQVLCTLWESNYEYDNYQPPQYPPINATLILKHSEVGYASLTLIFKISLLVLLSYFVYCVLTKPSFIRKWLAV